MVGITYRRDMSLSTVTYLLLIKCSMENIIYLHDVIFPHVGKIAIAVSGIKASEKGGALINVIQADESTKAMQEVGVTERSKPVAENARLVGSLAWPDVKNSNFVSLVAVE